LKRIEKGHASILKALQECDLADTTEHLGDLLKANFRLLKPYIKEIVVPDWQENDALVTIALDPKLAPEAQIKAYYKRAKKQRLGREPLQKAILKNESEKNKWEKRLCEIEATDDLHALLVLQNKFEVGLPAKKREVDQKKEPGINRFLSESQHVILVGKSAAANDHLTFQLLKGADVWLHVSHKAGSHVGIRVKSENGLDEETILDAANLAVYFSKARSDTGKVHEVVVTTRNCVHRIKGAPKGKVSLSKFRTVKIVLDITRIERLKG